MDQTPDHRLSVLSLPFGHRNPLATIKRIANAITDSDDGDTMIDIALS